MLFTLAPIALMLLFAIDLFMASNSCLSLNHTHMDISRKVLPKCHMARVSQKKPSNSKELQRIKSTSKVKQIRKQYYLIQWVSQMYQRAREKRRQVLHGVNYFKTCEGVEQKHIFMTITVRKSNFCLPGIRIPIEILQTKGTTTDKKNKLLKSIYLFFTSVS